MSVRFPDLQIFVEILCTNLPVPAQNGAAMLVYLQGTPTWRLENSVNIWNLILLSRPLIF